MRAAAGTPGPAPGTKPGPAGPGTTPAAAGSPGSAAPVARPLADAGMLVALGRGQAVVLPEDFRIGPLGNGQTGTPDKDAAFAAASSFLSRLVAGTVDRQAITPDEQESLADTLTYGLQQGYVPTSFRLGAPKDEPDGELAANLRLFDAVGSSEGEIYLSRAAGQWLIADVQIDLAQLAVPRTPSKERFFPSPYRWLLED